MEIKRSFGVLSITIDNDKSSMHHSNKYEKYQSFLDTAKVITCIEPGKLQDPFERLHGIGIFLLVEPGFSFDEIKFIKLSDYNRDVIELPDVVSVMVDGIVGVGEFLTFYGRLKRDRLVNLFNEVLERANITGKKMTHIV